LQKVLWIERKDVFLQKNYVVTLIKFSIKYMQALRQIVDITDNFLHVVLPDEFKAKKVEIIVLPIIEEQKKTQNEPIKLKNSERFLGAISKETAQKLHKHLNKVRNEWERDIY
jgi:hypothetical protein